MNSYYNIEDIITDGQKLPCNFEITVPGLGYLQGNIGQEIKENTKLELPIWLAELLAISGISPDSQTSFVSLLQPSILSPKVINALKTDAINVDLQAQNPVFLCILERWLALYADPALAQVAVDTIRLRATEIYDHANTHRAQLGQSSDFLQKLDSFEKRLFKAAHESSKDMRKWASQAK